jgi:hypothetical protein
VPLLRTAPSLAAYQPKRSSLSHSGDDLQEHRLFLEPPVTEEALPGEEGAYRYKYSGLRLLFRANDRLFLRPNDLSDPRNIVIAEDGTIRVEYT